MPQNQNCGIGANSIPNPFVAPNTELTMPVASLTKGSPVEVTSDENGFRGAWYVATLVDAIEPYPIAKKTSNKKNRKRKKTVYLVKYETLLQDNGIKQLTEIVDPSFVRPLPPPNPRRNNDNEADVDGGDFELYDVVDAYHREGWWIGVVNKVIIEGENKKFNVSFESPPEEFEFQRSQLRLHVDWIDGHWKVPPKKTHEHESADKTDGGRLSAKKKSRAPKKAETNAGTVGAMDPVEENSRGKKFQSSAASGSQAINQDSSQFEQETIITETCVTEDGKRSMRRKLACPQKFQLKRLNGLLEDNQEAGNVIHEFTTELEEQPISVWRQGLHSLLFLKRSSCRSTRGHRDEPSDTSNRAGVNDGETTESQQELPFIKQSPLWATLGSHEIYQNPPQNPHFSPLKNIKEGYREGLAIGHMVTFVNVVQRISKLQWTDPNTVFEDSLETLVDLETHGFDVSVVRARLNELLSTKVKASQLEDELKEAEKEVEKRNDEKTAIAKEIDEVEVKLQELQEKLRQKMMMKNAKDEEIMTLRSNLRRVSKRIKDQKRAFDILVVCPLSQDFIKP